MPAVSPSLAAAHSYAHVKLSAAQISQLGGRQQDAGTTRPGNLLVQRHSWFSDQRWTAGQATMPGCSRSVSHCALKRNAHIDSIFAKDLLTQARRGITVAALNDILSGSVSGPWSADSTCNPTGSVGR